MLEIHAIRREDLLTAFSLSADLLLRSRLYALAEHNVQQKRNTLGEVFRVDRADENQVDILHGYRSSFVWDLALAARGGFFFWSNGFALRAGQRQSWFFL